MIKNPNFLILDEPTNDLDIVTLSVLEDFLTKFQGCVLIVTHDRYFMDKLVQHLFVFEGNGVVRDFPGNYTEYRERKNLEDRAKASGKTDIYFERNEPELPEEKPTIKESVPSVNNSPKRKLSFKEKAEFEQLEKEIAQLETEKEMLTEKLNTGIADSKEIMESSKRIAEVIALLEEKGMRWLELSE
jgi:ABC transport system ATP-binding/permease protein